MTELLFLFARWVIPPCIVVGVTIGLGRPRPRPIGNRCKIEGAEVDFCPFNLTSTIAQSKRVRSATALRVTA